MHIVHLYTHCVYNGSLRAKKSNINFRNNCALFTGNNSKIQAYFIGLLH